MQFPKQWNHLLTDKKVDLNKGPAQILGGKPSSDQSDTHLATGLYYWYIIVSVSVSSMSCELCKQCREVTSHRMKDEVDQAAVRLLFLLDYAIFPGLHLSLSLSLCSWFSK